MAITFNDEIEKLIDQQMKNTGLQTPEEVVRMALASLQHTQIEYFEDLDPEVQAAINEGEADYQRGDYLPLDEAFKRILEDDSDL